MISQEHQGFNGKNKEERWARAIAVIIAIYFHTLYPM